jgi:23S rRNA-/tRNA-specific pseudouridylate synthase
LPIIGDYLYGKDEGIPMQLTAYKLIFKDPNDEIMTIEI